jgi:hypothetical protein
MKYHLYQLNILVADSSLILMLNKWLVHTFTIIHSKGYSFPQELKGIQLLSDKTQVKDQDLILFFRTPHPLKNEGREIFHHITTLFEREKRTSPLFLEWRKRTNSKDHFFYIQNYKKVHHSLPSRWLEKIKSLLKRKRRI